MKPRGFLLWISLAANALLFAVLVLRPAATTAFFRAVFQIGDQPNPAASLADATRHTVVAAQAKSAAFVPVIAIVALDPALVELFLTVRVRD